MARTDMLTGLLLLPLSALCGVALAASEGGPTAERPDRPAQERSHKDAPASEPKSKVNGSETKPSETAPAPSGDDKTNKPEEPASPPPPVLKQDEPPGKKPVASVNLAIKLAFLAEPLLFPFDIEVEMDHQKAILTGTVSSEEEKGKAGEIAQKIDGVESVTNKLSVSPTQRTAWTKKQDEALAHNVKERLNKSETLKAVGFDVKAENGFITLSGKTRFQVIALEAAEAARNVPGVRAVNTAGVQITGKD